MQRTGTMGRLRPSQLLGYGVMTMPLALGGFVTTIYLPTFYAVDMGLGLGLVGFVFVAGRIFDIASDPVIGHWSDETRSRLGPRLPWIIGGAMAYCLALWLLFSPPEDAGLVYLAFACGAFYLAYTALDIPYASIGLEISPYQHERSLLAGARTLFQLLGGMAAAILPLLMAVSIGASLPILAIAAIALSMLGLALLLFVVPRRTRNVEMHRQGLLAAVRKAMRDKRFRYLGAAFLFVQSANSFLAALLVLFATHVVGRPDLIGLFLLLLLAGAAIFLPLWLWMARRIGKKSCWMVAILVCMAALAGLAFVESGDALLAIILLAVVGGIFGADTILPTSMLADIVYDRELEGENRLAGLYQAVKNALSKSAFIWPMAIAFPLLGAIDFGSNEIETGEARWMFLLFYAALPFALRALALLILARAPDMRPQVAQPS